MRAKILRACSCLPEKTRNRGDAGISKEPRRNAAEGNASIQYIQRQAEAPSQKLASAPPATLARMSLLRNAQKSPSTMANCCKEASRPRKKAGATSAIYMGASTLAAPIPIPPAILEAIKAPAEPAPPDANALKRKRTALINIAGRRPIRLASVPAPKAPAAQPNRTDATAKPVPADWVPKAIDSACTVPLTTPLSKPKRKPPMAATRDIPTT